MNTLQTVLLIAFIMIGISLSLSFIFEPKPKDTYDWKYLSGDTKTEILCIDGKTIIKSKDITAINRFLADTQIKIITKTPKTSNN